MGRAELHVPSGGSTPSPPTPRGRSLTHLREAAGGQENPLSNGTPADPEHQSESQTPGGLPVPTPTLSSWPPPLPVCSLPPLPVAGLHCPVVPCPAEPRVRGGAATHELRGVWGPTALGGAPLPLRGPGLQGPLLGGQAGAAGSEAGVGDRHRHGDRGERARGRGSERAPHGTEELQGGVVRRGLGGASGAETPPTKPLASPALSRPQAVDTATPVCHHQGTNLIQAPDVCDLVVGGGRRRVGVGVQRRVRRLHSVAWAFGATVQVQLQAKGRRVRLSGAGRG